MVHQTREFTQFEYRDEYNLFGSNDGFYFTSSRSESSSYASNNSDNLGKGRLGVGAVLPVYLNIARMAALRAESWNVHDIDVQSFIEQMDLCGLIKAIKSKYNGIAYNKDLLNIPVEIGATHFIVFNSNQIKSAIGNNGQFSVENNEI